MRIVLLGAVRSTEVALSALAAAETPPVMLLTLPPELGERRHSDHVDLRPAAAEHKVEVTHTSSAKSETSREALRSAKADLLLVVGWSEILPAILLDTPRFGSLGYHPAPLPSMRGRAVMPWTILTERKETAGTLFWLAPGLDDGDIAYQVPFGLGRRETATSLYEKHMAALGEMLKAFAVAGSAAEIPRRPQDHSKATYCAQRKPVDGLIDWGQPADRIDCLIRATTRPYPGARCLRLRGERETVVWSATEISITFDAVPGQVITELGGRPVVACGEGYLRLDDVTGLDGEPIDLRVQDRFAPFGPAWSWWLQKPTD
jgi:methionyl-tRNA formyltransferase